MRIRPLKRLPHLFDDGKYELHPLPKVPADPLKFRDTERYDARLKKAQAKAEGTTDALVVASGLMGGRTTGGRGARLRLHGRFDGHRGRRGAGDGGRAGGRAQGAAGRVLRLGRARMQEGHPVADAAHPHHDRGAQGQGSGLPYIVVLTDPTTGGVSASFAMLGDIHLAEPGRDHRLRRAARHQDTIRQELPQGFQRSEYLAEHGMVDAVVHRHKLRETLIRMVAADDGSAGRRRPRRACGGSLSFDAQSHPWSG
jgi:acetyl-CoA carboxylase carboxyl transferase subunit beta